MSEFEFWATFIAEGVIPVLVGLWALAMIFHIWWIVVGIHQRQAEMVQALNELLKRVPPDESDLYPDEDDLEETNEQAK